MQGDDRLWNLQEILAVVHWGPNGKYTQVIGNLHDQQLRAPAIDYRIAYPEGMPAGTTIAP